MTWIIAFDNPFLYSNHLGLWYYLVFPSRLHQIWSSSSLWPQPRWCKSVQTMLRHKVHIKEGEVRERRRAWNCNTNAKTNASSIIATNVPQIHRDTKECSSSSKNAKRNVKTTERFAKNWSNRRGRGEFLQSSHGYTSKIRISRNKCPASQFN